VLQHADIGDYDLFPIRIFSNWYWFNLPIQQILLTVCFPIQNILLPI